jgi:hypothetical protein
MSKNKANNIFRIPCSSMEEFYSLWIDFLTPIHKLTSKNKQILLAFLMLRYELSQSITNETLLDEILMNEDSKAKIKERCNLQGNYLQVAMFTLAQQNVLIKTLSNDTRKKYKYRINPRILPDMQYTDTEVTLKFNFELKCNTQSIPSTTKQ